MENKRLDTIKKIQSIGPIRSDSISEIPPDEEVDTKKIKIQWLKEIQEVEDNLEQYIGGN